MSVPQRKAVIESVLARFQSQLEAPADQIDGIGRRLLPHFIEAMPASERPNWGVLEKRTSRPYSVPYDILVWKPTREHLDVLTSDEVRPGVRRLRATWGNAGVLPKPTWHWCDWRSTQTPIVPLEVTIPEPPPEPLPEPQPEPIPQPPPEADVHRKLDFIITELAAIRARQDRPLRP